MRMEVPFNISDLLYFSKSIFVFGGVFWIGSGWVGRMKAMLMVRLARSDQKMLSAVAVKITMEMMMVLIRFVDDHCDGRSVGLC